MKNIITTLILCVSILSVPLVANHEEFERLRKEQAHTEQLVAQLKARVDAQDITIKELSQTNKKLTEGNSNVQAAKWFAIGTYFGLFTGASLVSVGVYIARELLKK
jgi:hypothetical protein